MRLFHQRVAIPIVLWVAVAWAGAALAAPTLSLVWTGTTGIGATGGSSIEAAVGDVLTLDVVLTIDPAGFTGAAWDLEGEGATAHANTLIAGAGGPAECPSPPNLAPGTCFSATFKTFSPLSVGVADSGTDTTGYDVAGLTAEFVPSTMTLGRGVFQVTDAAGGSVSTYFAPGVGGVTDGGFNFSVPVPETAYILSLLQPDIEVSPLLLDFGDTNVGSTDLLMATITNVGTADLTINGVSIAAGGDAAFQITLAPASGTTIAPSGVEDIEVTFTPSASGTVGATLEISSSDLDESVVQVTLTGNGVDLDEQAMALLDFFDTADIDSTQGNRDRALRSLIESAGDFIDRGQIDQACRDLEQALLRVDGIEPPDSPPVPDFVEGPDAAALAAEIEALQDTLGCGEPEHGPACGLGFELALLIPALSLLRSRKRRA